MRAERRRILKKKLEDDVIARRPSSPFLTEDEDSEAETEALTEDEREVEDQKPKTADELELDEWAGPPPGKRNYVALLILTNVLTLVLLFAAHWDARQEALKRMSQLVCPTHFNRDVHAIEAYRKVELSIPNPSQNYVVYKVCSSSLMCTDPQVIEPVTAARVVFDRYELLHQTLEKINYRAVDNLEFRVKYIEVRNKPENLQSLWDIYTAHLKDQIKVLWVKEKPAPTPYKYRPQ
ncbi:unnamed protein product, partial [Mesorhabditis spiculigera]